MQFFSVKISQNTMQSDIEQQKQKHKKKKKIIPCYSLGLKQQKEKYRTVKD